MRGTLVTELVEPTSEEIVACKEGLIIVEEEMERAEVLMPEGNVAGPTTFVGPRVESRGVEIDELISGMEAVVKGKVSVDHKPD